MGTDASSPAGYWIELSIGPERILVYFVAIFRRSEFAKQCFMSHLGQSRGLGATAPCPNVEPPWLQLAL